jgi:hypothetical protein
MTTKQQKTHEPIKDLEGEVWKPIKGYEGRYEVSNMGRVKSLNYNHTKREKILKPRVSVGGYLTIGLTKNDKRHTQQIHRLVYDAFIGELPKYKRTGKGEDILEINHIDEDKTNNCVWNLELITHTENVNHGTGIQRRCESQKNKGNSKIVYQYTKNGELVRIFPSVMECDRNGFNKRNVNACCLGKKNHCYGYVWSYKPLTAQECLSLKSKENGEVYQFTFDGDLVKVWKHAAECRKYGFNDRCVRLCCLNEQTVHAGYFWSFNMLSKNEIEDRKESILKLQEDRRKKVYQYTLNLELIKVWDSVYECGKNGFSLQNITACCSGRRKSHKGYIWSHTPLFNND